MTYELAKKLKDAGFPQEAPEWRSNPDIGLVDDTNETDEDKIMKTLAYDPTLGELIEACGNTGFCLAFKDSDANWYSRKNNAMTEIHPGAGFHGMGKTPDEAVANLWLKINGK